MSTSIYLSNQSVSVVRGSVSKQTIKITDSCTAALPEGALINGVITDDRAIKEALDSLHRGGKLPERDIRLVIDSSNIFTKVETVPRLSHAQFLELTRNAFADAAGGRDDLLYDYAFLQEVPGGKQQVLCSAVESGMIQSYIALFESVGLALSSINIALCSVTKLIQHIKSLSEKSYILCVADGNVLSTMLFLAGKYRFSSRQRLLNQRGTPASSAEVLQSISSMVQFNSAQKTGFTIDTVYFCGLRKEEQGLYQEVMTEFHLSAAPLPLSREFILENSDPNAPYSISDYLFATGNLIEK